MSHYNFRAKGSSLMKLYHETCRWVGMITGIQLLQGSAAIKLGRAKNVQNLLRLRTTFNIECKYLWIGWSDWQVLNSIINHDPSRIKQKTLHELWSTKHKVAFARYNLRKVNSAHVFGQL